MKTGRTLTDMAIELERQQNAKRDFVADTRKVSMDGESNNMLIDLNGNVEQFDVTKHAHHQIAQWSKIPQQYYDRMPKELRAINVNHWMHNEPKKRMVRTLDGNVRAFMSDRYRTLDNFDLADAVLPVLMEQQDMQIVSAELTDKRMYIKALFPRIENEVGVGDTVQSGVVISNSEIGQGSLRVEPLVYRLVCLNGMISSYSQKRYHVGKTVGAGEAAMEIYRDETVAADDKAFWMKVQDTVRASVSQAAFDNIVDEMRRTKGMFMEGSPVEVIERVQKRFSWNENESNSVLQHLITGADLSAYGLLNAITRTSQDIEDYDRATDFERMGGKIIELAPTEWREIAQAA